MKKVIAIVGFICFFTHVSYSQFSKKEIKLVNENIERKVKTLYDRYEETITFHTDKIELEEEGIISDDYGGYIQFYFVIGKNNDEMIMSNLFVTHHLSSDDWVFLDDVTYLVGTRDEFKNNQYKRVILTSDETDRELGETRGGYFSGNVNEKFTKLVSKEYRQVLDDIINNDKKRILIKFSGSEGWVERSISAKKLTKELIPFLETYNNLTQLIY